MFGSLFCSANSDIKFRISVPINSPKPTFSTFALVLTDIPIFELSTVFRLLFCFLKSDIEFEISDFKCDAIMFLKKSDIKLGIRKLNLDIKFGISVSYPFPPTGSNFLYICINFIRDTNFRPCSFRNFVFSKNLTSNLELTMTIPTSPTISCPYMVYFNRARCLYICVSTHKKLFRLYKMEPYFTVEL